MAHSVTHKRFCHNRIANAFKASVFWCLEASFCGISDGCESMISGCTYRNRRFISLAENTNTLSQIRDPLCPEKKEIQFLLEPSLYMCTL